MCLVEVSTPRGLVLQPACVLSVAEGQDVRTASARARKAQQGVLEFLLVNHPLDCPVCDKGGECPLQDQALSHGPGESRFAEEKRHWAKPIEIGPRVLLDRERCIQCARCTRFAAEVAGEPLIDLAFRSDAVEVATFPGKPFDSYFSGNTIQICPVGALTSPAYRFKARPWDLEQVETTCTTCAVGCRVVAQSSAGQARAVSRRRLRPGEPELAVRQGPLRLRGGPLGQPPRRADGGTGRRPRPGDLARSRSTPPRPRSAVPTHAAGRSPSRSSAGRDCRTRTPTPGPGSPRRSSARTPSTPSSTTGSRPRRCSACRTPRSTRPWRPGSSSRSRAT